MFGAVLSRSTVFEFKPVSAADARRAAVRAVALLNEREGERVVFDDAVLDHIAASCGGDVRKAMNAVELLFTVSIVATLGTFPFMNEIILVSTGYSFGFNYPFFNESMRSTFKKCSATVYTITVVILAIIVVIIARI